MTHSESIQQNEQADYRDYYQSLFDSLASYYSTFSGESLTPFREIGLKEFISAGFPTRKDEDWRFTNLKELESFQPAWSYDLSKDTSFSWDSIPFSDLDQNRLVFVNGVYSSEHSQILDQSQGVDLMPLSAAIKTGLIRAEEMGQYTSDSHQNSFVPLNDALFQDGLFLRVAKNATVNGLIQVLYYTDGASGNVHFPRQVVIMGEGSSATVLEQHHSKDGQVTFKNCVSEFYIGDRSDFECAKLQMEPESALHFGSYFIQANQESDFRLHSIDLGAALSRNSIKTHLGGSQINGVLNGLYIGKGKQLSDHHMVVEHMQPSCDSHEYFNGILDDQARGVFHGRIFVDQKGQKTDAKQTNKNILLTDDVTIDTKPQLEIYADDVKCTHGATVGQLSEDSLFYLQARGIPRREARRMLIHAFAGEIVERIESDHIRLQMDEVVWDYLDHLPSLI